MYKIIHGIFFNGSGWYRDGWHHYSTRTRILNIPYKFASLLETKSRKFSIKYRIKYVCFTIIIDLLTDIQAIAIHYSHFDLFSESIGEKIVLGRINKYFRKVQWTKMKHKLHASGSGKPMFEYIQDENGKIIKKYVMIQRTKMFKPYPKIPKFIYKPDDKNESKQE